MPFETLFFQYAQEEIQHISLLPASGSSRKYYRIQGKKHQCLGVENNDHKENVAFINYSQQFLQHGLPVPNILAQDLDNKRYLIEDLGDTTLYQYMVDARKKGDFPDHLKDIYHQIIPLLLRFQIEGGQNFDYQHAYPRAAFDKQSMLWDLNYFKYYFLKLAQVAFDEQALENDFERLTQYLLLAPANYFLYRDFQSRNIMLKDEHIYFIDYQGGRRGPLHYDLASLLYDGKADIPQAVREELLDKYILELNKIQSVDPSLFQQQFYAFVFIRIMQAMGTYGFRGFYEKKEHFLKSIPFAIDNIEYLLEHHPFPIPLPALTNALQQITRNSQLRHQNYSPSNLHLDIQSFSFRKGYPADPAGNGGGFVFDCRGLPNPGRFTEYKNLTGKDHAVAQYLEKYEEVSLFIDNAYRLISPTILNYMERDFSNLQVSFGCTGGQHRSVYCAEKLYEKILQNYPIQCSLSHREQKYFFFEKNDANSFFFCTFVL